MGRNYPAYSPNTNTLKISFKHTPLQLPVPLFVSHDLHRAEVVALVAGPQLPIGVCSPGVQ